MVSISKHVEIPLIGKKGQYSWRWIIGIVASGVLILGATTIIKAGNSENRKPDITKLTVPVEAKDLTVRITASGKVQPIQSVNVSPKNAGLLAELNVEQGQKVEQGQIIARMDDSEIRMGILQFQANLEQAKAQLADAEAGSRVEDIAQAKARVNQAKAQLEIISSGSRSQEIEQAKASVEGARSQLELTQARLNRYQKLAKEGAISQDTLDQYIAENKRAKSNLREAEKRLSLQEAGNREQEIRRQQAVVTQETEGLRKLQNGSRPQEIARLTAVVEAAKAQLKRQQVQLEDTIIRAPFAGIITQKYANIGAFVTPTTSASSSTSATSSSIVALARGLEVLALIPEADIARIKQGQQVEIISDAYPEQVFTGRVRLIAPEAVIEQGVTSFQVRIFIVNGGDKLRSGLNVDVTFLGDRLEDAITIPTVAILTEDGKTGVLVPDSDNKPEFREITMGAQIKNETQVLTGIQTGDLIFINPPKDYKSKKPN
ncbi:efflux transporter periplasmic adaptor subunit [Cylindrospermopsis raciborskii S07]|uniref:efflux RND transporter periplasmic adaptor subunit n=1 Tax=Cylindrospermopsis raciborskii TaxID=77022 RepID=UPI000C9E7A51|nr:efflux RND transporter periplasmic adaptor subunit [Cylindrospermopsis raciborskii]PNK04941.1 efflux transporter periplasmic adaptor subunit [Cylindrospermopsis raciborskii S14]PNK07565.1 efflux transporter periplasmic adaptor subunit [Cylindrospermopsis raciborskii S10]PNK08077.1 efflux transporter periplasmic adaptor subunit [Cylindrospermopsis raciborskii S07]PNK17382.1 efflux transporter periplasmic adaptor subunit [Cylindrospermopsis raciborskii S06]PNK19092.1 efflux transporter peripl